MDEDNSSNWRLTVKELRRCKGFENITDEEGEKVIDNLVQLSLISFNIDINDFKIERPIPDITEVLIKSTL